MITIKKYKSSWVFLLVVIYCSCNVDNINNKEDDCLLKDTIKTFYDNGQIRSYELTCNGFKNGISCFYLEDGILEKCQEFKNDLLNGTTAHYFPNGQIRLEANFKNGNLDGFYRIYDENGNVIREIIYNNGTAIR